MNCRISTCSEQFSLLAIFNLDIINYEERDRVKITNTTSAVRVETREIFDERGDRGRESRRENARGN